MDETPINQLKKIERDENFLVKGVDYKFTPEGLVDWRAMVPIQFLYVNNDIKNRERVERVYGKPYNEIDIIKDKVKDSDLIILLGGIKYIAKLRSFKSISYNIHTSNQEYVAVNCKIKFSGNYETLGEDIDFEDNACAHLNNTNSFATRYLLEMATNRAFCRAVRNFLNINIVSKEEIFSNAEQEQPKSVMAPSKQIKMLDNIMEAKGASWPQIIEKLKKENKWDDKYKSTADLPGDIIFDYIERLKKLPNKTS